MSRLGFIARKLGLSLAIVFTGALAHIVAQAQPPSPSPPSQKPSDGKADEAPPPPSGAIPSGTGGAIIVPKTPDAPAVTGKATLPRPLNYVPPEYPPEAKKQGLEGTVTLQIDIDRDGKVMKASVVEPAGHGFDEAALAAVKKLEFEPARRADGTSYAARIFYRYSFDLKPKTPDQAAPAAGAAIAAENVESLAGTVLSADGDVPLVGATVTVTGAPNIPAETTGDTGKFSIRGLPAGKYQVTIEVPGYKPLSIEEEIAAGESIEVKYRLVPIGQGIEVTVRGTRPPREVTRRTLQAREIDRIPGTNGDALRSIQSLPGVARPPAILGLLLVRGSGPQDTQTFIDGTFVPLIYHFGGLSSVVPTEVLEKIDFYPGNFSAQYGRVMGGIVDAGIRSPKSDGYHGLVQIDLIDARLLVEGPVPLFDDVTFIAAGRRSHIDSWLGPVLESAGAGVTQAPVYYDYQFLVEKKISESSRARVAFLGSDDALEVLVKQPSPQEPALTGNVGFRTSFQRIQLQYENEISEDHSVRALLALGQDDLHFGLGSFYFLLNFKTLSGRLEYTNRLSKGIRLNTGLDMSAGIYTARVRIPAPSPPGQPANQPFSTRTVRELEAGGNVFFPAAYAELEIVPTARARIVPGVRLDYANLSGRYDVSPRVNGRFDIVQGFPRTTAKGGVGIFHQPPQFQEAVEPIGTANLQTNRAIQYAIGAEQEITRQIELSVEGFYKQLDSLVRAETIPGRVDLQWGNGGEGYVVGAEVLLKYKPDERFFGWLAYTLSRSSRVDRPGEEDRLVAWDQPHILTVLGSYKLGHGWEMGARFRLVSGNLLTPNVCNVELETCNPNRTNSLFHAASGAYTPIPFSGPGSERMPLYHSLDLRVDRTFRFKRWQLSAYLDIQNVYNHANVEAIGYNFNYTARQYVSGITILPSIGVRADF